MTEFYILAALFLLQSMGFGFFMWKFNQQHQKFELLLIDRMTAREGNFDALVATPPVEEVGKTDTNVTYIDEAEEAKIAKEQG